MNKEIKKKRENILYTPSFFLITTNTPTQTLLSFTFLGKKKTEILEDEARKEVKN